MLREATAPGSNRSLNGICPGPDEFMSSVIDGWEGCPPVAQDSNGAPRRPEVTNAVVPVITSWKPSASLAVRRPAGQEIA